MTQQARGPRVHERWAHLRFSVIGQLLAAPPTKGELKAAIEALAERTWRHPTTGEPVRFGFSTRRGGFSRQANQRCNPCSQDASADPLRRRCAAERRNVRKMYDGSARRP